ncbi:MAG: hypothetical protein K2H23_07740, partial [Oscillospiraceae bacterium]|nr:hypothetical protein [Oscillospiraceae bacterium]
RIYYVGNNKGRNCTVFSTDYEGNVKKSLEIKSGLKDENGELSTYGETIKQVGDYLYYFYTATPYIDLNLPETGEWVDVTGVLTPYYYTPQSFKCLKLDKELNIIDEYELKDYVKGGQEQFVDVNSTKIAYVKSGKKIYTMNHDGSGKKLLYTVGDKGIDTYHVNSIAMNEDYIVFMAQASRGTYKTLKGSNGTTIYEYDPDYTYCGIIDLKTGEVTLENKDGASFVKTNGSIFMWEDNSTEPWSGKNGTIHTFDGKSLSSIKTKSSYESYYHTADDDGKIMGVDIKANVIRIYENDKLTKTVSISDNGNENFTIGDFAANNGIAAVSYSTNEGTSAFTVNVKLIAY